VGIVAAESGVITPFDKIGTYLNLSDDISEGKSLFMAEVKRAQDHLDTLSGLRHDKFSFCIMDELFTGTNPVEGEAVAYSIAYHMGKYKNGITIAATHFPRLMLLEEHAAEDGFKNFKVIVHRNPETGELQYPFTITPGKSNQTVALDILAQEGFDRAILDKARDVIDNPDNYKATFN
jgi:DNA mismatch repair ATPase MutS